VTRKASECFLCATDFSYERSKSSPCYARWCTGIRYRKPPPGTRLRILDLGKVAAGTADRIKLRPCSHSTRAGTLGFISACAQASFLIGAGPVDEIAMVPTRSFARIHGDPDCNCWPRVPGVLSTTNLVWQARDTLPLRRCANFFGTELSGESGALESSFFFEVQTNRVIIDLSHMTTYVE
jgi:hypothetical protein